MELHDIDENGNEVLSKTEEVKPGKKTSADIIESILGLVFLRKGFQAAFDVATELGVTLPRDREYEITSFTKNYKQKQELVSFVENFLDLKFKHPELIEEATTHPSCMSILTDYEILIKLIVFDLITIIYLPINRYS